MKCVILFNLVTDLEMNQDNIIKLCFIGEKSNFDKLDKGCTVDTTSYKNLRKNVMIEYSTPNVECFQQFLYMAGYNIIPDEVEAIRRAKKRMNSTRTRRCR